MRRFFNFDLHHTSYRREIVAGVTTFLTMAYIIVVNPAILETAGIPKGPSLTTTIIASTFGTVLMALYAKRPFAIAPYMGENAFITFTVVKAMGYSWQIALGAIFLAGCLFALLTVFRIRSWLAEGIPTSLKHSFSVGIGLFVTFVGLNQTGIVVLGVPGAPVAMGQLDKPATLLAMLGFVIMAFLLARKVQGALIVGILTTTVLSFILGVTPLPGSVVSLPVSPLPIVGQLDISGALSPRVIPVVLIIFVMAFVDTVGTLLGLSARAGLLDEQGNLPEIEKPMLADAVSNMISPCIGTTTTGAFIESAVGIEAGGRTGFTALVVAFLFVLSLFFAPVLTAVPPHAYGPALIVIGSLMIAPVSRLDFSDFTELLPAFVTIVMIIFTYNIGVGMTAGLLLFPVLKVLTGRVKEVRPAMWVLALMAISFFVYYPYRSG